MADGDISGSTNREPFPVFYAKRSKNTRYIVSKWLSRSSADVENAHSEAWLKFYQKYVDKDFEFESSPDAYLATCIYHEIMTCLREYSEGDQPYDLGDRASLSDVGNREIAGNLLGPFSENSVGVYGLSLSDPASWSNRELAWAVSELSLMQRSVILFWAWKEPPPTDREIGYEFGIEATTAKTHRTRALAKLRTLLNRPVATEKEDSK